MNWEMVKCKRLNEQHERHITASFSRHVQFFGVLHILFARLGMVYLFFNRIRRSRYRLMYEKVVSSVHG